jgi:hypothetical protein
MKLIQPYMLWKPMSQAKMGNGLGVTEEKIHMWTSEPDE